jgi:hypothetical protein
MTPAQFDATVILLSVVAFLMLCAAAAARDLRRERITQERHDANARTMRHIEAVRRGE